MERIRAGQFSFDAPEWTRVSQAAKSIIEGTFTLRYAPTLVDAVASVKQLHSPGIIVCKFGSARIAY